ncbi:PT domain-containing protein [Candidatus Peregrinibacteria bacterium]|nr:PT domain-containing protein [Candidatus Peregrinibacteria bacterium]
MAPNPTTTPAENPANQPAAQPPNQPAAKPPDAAEKPKEEPGSKPVEARKGLTAATNANVTAETAVSKEDQELVDYVESLGIEDPNFKKLILFFAKIWTAVNRIASNFSLFDDLDKTPKNVKLKPDEETKVKELGQRDLAKIEIDQATLDRLNKLGNEAAATAYICVALGIAEIVDPKVLLKSLDNVKMAEERGFTRVSDYGVLSNKKPLKKGTIVFTNFNLLTGELIPCIATGNEGELKMLYPPLKGDSKEGNLPKIEQSIYLYDGEPRLTQFQFRAALVPNFVTSADDAVVDAKDDTGLGKILGYEAKTKDLIAGVFSDLDAISNLQETPTVDLHKEKISKFEGMLAPLTDITNAIEELRVNYSQMVEKNPVLKPKLLEKFTAAANAYIALLDKVTATIDEEIAKLNKDLAPILEKISLLTLEKDQPVAELNAGQPADATAEMIVEGELESFIKSKVPIEDKIKEFADIKLKFSDYYIALVRLNAVLADQAKVPGDKTKTGEVSPDKV